MFCISMHSGEVQILSREKSMSIPSLLPIKKENFNLKKGWRLGQIFIGEVTRSMKIVLYGFVCMAGDPEVTQFLFSLEISFT